MVRGRRCAQKQKSHNQSQRFEALIRLILHGHTSLIHHSLPVCRAAGARILLANSSSSDATQKDSGISTPGFNLTRRGSVSHVRVYVFGSSMVRFNWIVL